MKVTREFNACINEFLFSNVSIFDVEDNAELQELVSNLPLFPYMEISVKPLCRHPSSVRDDDS